MIKYTLKKIYRVITTNKVGKPVFLSISKDLGIGNRVKSMASRFRYFQTKKMYLCWSTKTSVFHSDIVMASFKDLFSLSKEYKIHEINMFFPRANDIFTDNQDFWQLWVEKNDFKANDPYLTRENPINGIYTIDYEYNRIPAYICDIYRPFFMSLKPSPKVRKRLESASSHIPKEFTALHVRNNTEWNEAGRSEDLKFFFDKIDELSEQSKNSRKDFKIFLACTNTEISSIFHAKYPGVIFELPEINYSSTIDAVASLYMLAQGTELIASFGSTFSEVAWWIGGCRQKVTNIGFWDHWIK